VRKVIFLVGVGIAIGYFVGFQDAQAHAQDIVHRAVLHVEKTSRDRDANDVDAMMRRVEKN
jgi:hypothetical protein